MTRTPNNLVPIKRAILSVWDKTGIVELAQQLHQLNVHIYSTGGTAAKIVQAGIPVTELSTVTGFGEMFDGRVKTLHPAVHAGLLARDGDLPELEKMGYQPFDLVVINLYPFVDAINTPSNSYEDCIEMIDIGGPSMLRSSSKNHSRVCPVSSQEDYALLSQELSDHQGQVSLALRSQLARKTFARLAAYDGSIANWLAEQASEDTNKDQPLAAAPIPLGYEQKQVLRYGENPHQQAALYVKQGSSHGLAGFKQIQGKAMSWNNFTDLTAAWNAVQSFDSTCCVIVKHGNPCGVAEAENCVEAFEKALLTDKTSAFGGIIAFNRPIDADTVQAIINFGFVEVVVAPQVSAEAAQAFTKRKNVRLATMPTGRSTYAMLGNEHHLLVQTDPYNHTEPQWKVAGSIQPDDTQWEDIKFAWNVGKSVKSNAIVLARDKMTIGVGAGQMSRVFSAQIASIKAANEGLETQGSVVASDAFFPFRDGIDTLASYGVKAIVQPGGSIRDDEIISAADEHQIAMIFTGTRYFLH